MEDDPRPRPPRHAPERETLQGFLDSQRAALLWKLDGLDTEQATRRLLPSAITLLGIVKHCMDVERRPCPPRSLTRGRRGGSSRARPWHRSW
jgi:hypothetical protein